MHFCFQPYYNFTLLLYLTYHLFLYLLSTNHKCTQPCYFILLLKLAAQKMKMVTRIGTQGTTPHRLERPKEGSIMTRSTIQKIPEDPCVLPKAQIIIFIKIYVK
jgi:hypothetical protein